MLFLVPSMKSFKEQQEGYVHSTESFGTVDGPGSRFVVFFQGCPLRCQYCHNPDTWELATGGTMTVKEILSQYEQCKAFLNSGGITVTGGEPLMQMDFLRTLFNECKASGIHTCLDTSGITFTESKRDEFDELMKVCDLVMLDIKHIDDEGHKALTGMSNKNVLAFAKYLGQVEEPMWVRHVVVPGITLKKQYLIELGHFLGSCKNLKALDVLPYHVMGKVKYEELGLTPPLEGVPPATSEQAIAAKNLIIQGMRERLIADDAS